MAKKYGAWYVAKRVIKGMTAFGVGLIFGYATESLCEEAGFGKLASTTAKVGAYAVGGMIVNQTFNYIDATAYRLEQAIGRKDDG